MRGQGTSSRVHGRGIRNRAWGYSQDLWWKRVVGTFIDHGPHALGMKALCCEDEDIRASRS